MVESLVDVLRRQSERTPDAEALWQTERRLSYAELWSRVHSLAGHLSARGVRRQERVALLLENSIEYVIAYYGVLAAGGAWW
jgi:acyl-CoA synthetase (AMP-forming)/AMP-acid ligase II